MLIKYTGTNVHALATKDGKVIASLRPGWNEFPMALFKANENDSEVCAWIKSGKLAFLSKGYGKKAKPLHRFDDEELHLSELEADQALEVVKETYNRAMLQRWLDEETRHRVKRAVDKQLRKVNNGGEEEDQSA